MGLSINKVYHLCLNEKSCASKPQLLGSFELMLFDRHSIIKSNLQTEVATTHSAETFPSGEDDVGV